MKNIIIIFSVFLIVSCSSKKNIANEDTELKQLFEMMQGSYDSSLQAAQDSTYYNISLEMHPVWHDSGEHWLYVEQALASRKEKPYRVRMYRLKRINDSEIASEVYTIPDEQSYYGKYNNPKAFKDLTPNDLELRKGCAVILKKTGTNEFSGSTGKTSCASSLRGASYATSTVLMNDLQIISWDRGFDASGKQVWGAEKGGYIFMKKSVKLVKQNSLP